jgi:hypothetical protein
MLVETRKRIRPPVKPAPPRLGFRFLYYALWLFTMATMVGILYLGSLLE